MNMLEQKFMELVPGALLRIAKTLEGINEKLELLANVSEKQKGQVLCGLFEGGPDNQEDFRSESISKIADELDLIDELEVIERRKSKPLTQRTGYSSRFYNCCRSSEIKTVGDLLDWGRNGFCSIRNMGRQCTDRVSAALEKLYGITTW